jgi:hypothetical protein
MSNFTYTESSFPICTVSLGSMTMAIKARRLLSQRGIEVKVKKLGEKNEARGCIYGIEYPCSLSGNILSIIRSSGIEVFF